MFTGIIESLGLVKNIEIDNTNMHIHIETAITNECKIDQSISHNGVCLTIVEINNSIYKVTAIDETLQKTNLKHLKIGDKMNLERAMIYNARLDGHIVQGHVDDIGTCIEIQEQNGSWLFTFTYNENQQQVIVEKGSICINGTSLTAFNVTATKFTVAIIPYTYEHTNFHNLQIGDTVNLEFDILGKYIAKLMKFK